MSSSKGFGQPTSSIRARQRANQTEQSNQWQNFPTIEAAERIALWEAGLLYLQLPDSLQPRSLTAAERDWLDQVVKAEYLTSENNGRTALFYTAPPPDFRLTDADWYLHPDHYWNARPLPLSTAMQQFPVACFQLSATGQAPGFYPDPTSGYSMQQETVMRQIFRETVRLGWSLADYKWWVMRSLHKTTAQVAVTEANQLLERLQSL
ncbi:hypothetical protein [Leptolyngbya sp. NIES-2104]|uniref:hypothetical protein n=1 Tax=Leptolyngbya sp. NIES-2104 TaxID=1552121 RepID=UPI0006ECB06E|nr:hypothetical protein [Leptolyngbya sp. NIES-2104]GAP99865.1 hypothetical protein NIES2104_64310 [Leptolyngbya sp. NIES-2104]